MKIASFIFALLISFTSFSQQTDFTVAAGVQRTLTAAERTLSLKNLILGDDCTIIIPASMDGWTVTATDATIGKNVKIMGIGLNGNSGAAGYHGVNGVACGGATRGGNGGPGGNGGYATCTCNAGPGANGGNGGNGGAGSNGGNVTILYSAIGSTSVSNSNFIIQNTGGRSGMGGFPGPGGAGGAGGGCNDPKALVRQPGAAGQPGIAGASTIQGANGVTVLQDTGK